MDNPFFVGNPVPPERFVGRTAEVLDAFDHLLNCGHLAIWGGPGVGKSSFLQTIAGTAQGLGRHHEPQTSRSGEYVSALDMAA